MNIRNLKLNLTTELINSQGQGGNILLSAKSMMNHFREEAGRFVEQVISQKQDIGKDIEKNTYSLRYENITLDIDLVKNKMTHQQHLHNFSLRA